MESGESGENGESGEKRISDPKKVSHPRPPIPRYVVQSPSLGGPARPPRPQRKSTDLPSGVKTKPRPPLPGGARFELRRASSSPVIQRDGAEKKAVPAVPPRRGRSTIGGSTEQAPGLCSNSRGLTRSSGAVNTDSGRAVATTVSVPPWSGRAPVPAVSVSVAPASPRPPVPNRASRGQLPSMADGDEFWAQAGYWDDVVPHEEGEEEEDDDDDDEWPEGVRSPSSDVSDAESEAPRGRSRANTLSEKTAEWEAVEIEMSNAVEIHSPRPGSRQARSALASTQPLHSAVSASSLLQVRYASSPEVRRERRRSSFVLMDGSNSDDRRMWGFDEDLDEALSPRRRRCISTKTTGERVIPPRPPRRPRPGKHSSPTRERLVHSESHLDADDEDSSYEGDDSVEDADSEGSDVREQQELMVRVLSDETVARGESEKRKADFEAAFADIRKSIRLSSVQEEQGETGRNHRLMEKLQALEAEQNQRRQRIISDDFPSRQETGQRGRESPELDGEDTGTDCSPSVTDATFDGSEHKSDEEDGEDDTAGEREMAAAVGENDHVGDEGDGVHEDAEDGQEDKKRRKKKKKKKRKEADMTEAEIEARRLRRERRKQQKAEREMREHMMQANRVAAEVTFNVDDGFSLPEELEGSDSPKKVRIDGSLVGEHEDEIQHPGRSPKLRRPSCPARGRGSFMRTTSAVEMDAKQWMGDLDWKSLEEDSVESLDLCVPAKPADANGEKSPRRSESKSYDRRFSRKVSNLFGTLKSASSSSVRSCSPAPQRTLEANTTQDMRVPSKSAETARSHHFHAIEDFLAYLRSTTELRSVVSKEELDRNLSELFETCEGSEHILMAEGHEDDQAIDLSYVEGMSQWKLVQLLTSHERCMHPAEFVSTFLLMYRTLWTPREFIELLVFRYNIEPPKALFSVTELTRWYSAVQHDIQQSTLRVMLTWVENYFDYDIRPNPLVVDTILNFLEVCLTMKADQSAKAKIKQALAVQLFPSKKHKKKKKYPRPFAPSKKASLSLMDINPTELARQITLLEWEIFKSISPRECSNQAWLKPDKLRRAPNIMRMIKQFNSITNWVAAEILERDSAKLRAMALYRVMVVAEECRALQNFNAVMTFVAALQSSPIYRLKKTWSLLPSKAWDIWEALFALMDNTDNYAVYRKVMRQAEPPAIPYLGITLTDLVFLDEGNAQYVGEHKLLNMCKITYGAGLLHNLECKKTEDYLFMSVPAIQTFLRSLPRKSEKELMSLSIEREPRKR